MVNNESLTALKWFGIEADAAGNNGIRYNDVVRWIYDALYKMNIECDIIYSESTDIEKYKAVILPAMYVADEKLLKRLKDYTMHGGTLIATFKTAFANENVKVYPDRQPHILNEVFGIYYQQFTFPKNVTLTGFESGAPEAEHFMELLMSEGAETVLSYQHSNWKNMPRLRVMHMAKVKRGILDVCLKKSTCSSYLPGFWERTESMRQRRNSFR